MRTLLAAGAFLAAASIARAGGVDWMTDVEKAKAKAKEQGKLVHVHFTADW
jgi:hypothetical protein